MSIQYNANDYIKVEEDVPDYRIAEVFVGLRANPVLSSNLQGFYPVDIAWVFEDGRLITMYVSTSGCDTCGYGAGTFYTIYNPKDAPSPQK